MVVPACDCLREVNQPPVCRRASSAADMAIVQLTNMHLAFFFFIVAEFWRSGKIKVFETTHSPRKFLQDIGGAEIGNVEI